MKLRVTYKEVHVSKIEYCYGVSVCLLLSYFYFQYKVADVKEKMDYIFSEEGVEPTMENFHEASKLMDTDERLYFLIRKYRDHINNSRVSLFLSLSLLGWCFVL